MLALRPFSCISFGGVAKILQLGVLLAMICGTFATKRDSLS
jgi:hypothetical protein